MQWLYGTYWYIFPTLHNILPLYDKVPLGHPLLATWHHVSLLGLS